MWRPGAVAVFFTLVYLALQNFLQAKKCPHEGGKNVEKIRLRQHRGGVLSKTWGNYIYSVSIGTWLETSIAWLKATFGKR